MWLRLNGNLQDGPKSIITIKSSIINLIHVCLIKLHGLFINSRWLEYIAVLVCIVEHGITMERAFGGLILQRIIILNLIFILVCKITFAHASLTLLGLIQLRNFQSITVNINRCRSFRFSLGVRCCIFNKIMTFQ